MDHHLPKVDLISITFEKKHSLLIIYDFDFLNLFESNEESIYLIHLAVFYSI